MRFFLRPVFYLFLITANLMAADLIVVEDLGLARKQIVQKAKSFLGIPYIYGGTSRNGLDCSGLTFLVYKDLFGKAIPRGTQELYKIGIRIDRQNLVPGDLLFFDTTGGVSHVAIYIGNGKIIQAASAGSKRGVITSSLDAKYYRTRYLGARRLVVSSKTALVPKTGPAAAGGGVDIKKMAGRWKGAKGFKYVLMDSLGNAKAVLETGQTMRLKLKVEGASVIFTQAEMNKPYFYLSFAGPKVARELTYKARPMRWIFSLSKDGTKLLGIKETSSFRISGARVVAVDNNFTRQAEWQRM